MDPWPKSRLNCASASWMLQGLKYPRLATSLFSLLRTLRGLLRPLGKSLILCPGRQSPSWSAPAHFSSPLQATYSSQNTLGVLTIPLGFKWLQITTPTLASPAHLGGVISHVISSCPPPGWLSCCLYYLHLITMYRKSPAIYLFLPRERQDCVFTSGPQHPAL